MKMDEMWEHKDLELVAEKKVHGENTITKDDWTRHVVDLKEGEEIKWSIRHGFYHPPYEGDHVYHFTFLEAGSSLCLKAERDNVSKRVILTSDGHWKSGWYDVGDASYRVTLHVKPSIYSVSELPDGVRTMQQSDHDAWEYAVQNGLI
jgi:hypothetical protein